ncbi:MAG: 1-(5-phosphoribosyl)-5-[(5-phosphoribosylamino)methylideneamino]imidazole-4-carboxamide isomerase [Firmicutes bacterium]|nr:1-(5-phosphoribosyl)-5-[(5-phosphoribosylamino)methylideneamino]imidazole-4-carboxamide isomerase [Bacillota bacterium]
MILFPAIDILKGRSVRLLHGAYNRVTDYGEPVEMAKKWEAQGAEFLHIVDLDGAKAGMGVNSAVVKQIVQAVKIPVQLGGGIRTLSDIAARLNDTGAARVILGTACCENPQLIAQAVSRFGAEKIVAGIDAKDGFVAVKGWLECLPLSPFELGKKMYAAGLRYTVFTDIGRDGALSGVNVSACAEMTKQTKLQCIASGGVSALSDLHALKKEGLYGAILGRAIYEKKFSVDDALKAISSKE